MTKIDVIYKLIQELKMRGINCYIIIKYEGNRERTIQSLCVTDETICNTLYDKNGILYKLYVITPHGKELIKILNFDYFFDMTSLIITYHCNNKIKVINLCN